MTARSIYYLLTLALALFSILIFFEIKNTNQKNKYKFKKNYKLLTLSLIDKLNDKEINGLLNSAGFKISIAQYKIIRVVVLFLLLFLTFFVQSNSLSMIKVLILFVLYIISIPKTTLFNYSSPFALVMNLFAKENTIRKNIEIYRAISQLRNLSSTRKDHPPGSAFIFEQLRKFTKTTRPVFNRFISLYNENRKKEAYDYFVSEINTKEAKDLADVMLKLDDLEPQELRTQLILYQENSKRERETISLKKAENISYLIFLMVIISTAVILINFIIVVYYLDSINQLKFMY